MQAGGPAHDGRGKGEREARSLGATTTTTTIFFPSPPSLRPPLPNTHTHPKKEFGPSLKVVKVNADPAPGLVEKYKVYGLPTLIIFKGGEPVPGSQREGAINKAKLLDYLASHGLSPAGVEA